MVTLLDLAYKLIEKAGIPKENAFDVLQPLINGTLNNIKNNSLEKALTGPIIRGDTKTVLSHIDEINNQAPELNELYKILGLYTLKIAEQNLSKQTIESFKTMLQ